MAERSPYGVRLNSSQMKVLCPIAPLIHSRLSAVVGMSGWGIFFSNYASFFHIRTVYKFKKFIGRNDHQFFLFSSETSLHVTDSLHAYITLRKHDRAIYTVKSHVLRMFRKNFSFHMFSIQ